MVELAAGLLAAGHETTATQIPNFLYVPLTHPAQMALLRDTPELIPVAVEELLRYVPLGAAPPVARYATEDVDLGGARIRAGEPVIASLISANRDSEVFDRPDALASPGRPTRTSASVTGYTTALAHSWPGWNCR